MTLLARLALVLALAFGAAAPAAAETAPKLPKGMTQAEFDRLVVAISREVLKQLRDQGAKPEAAPPAPGIDAPALARRFGEIAATYPLFAQRVGDLGRVLDARESGGRSALGLVVLLVLAAAAALAIERAVSAALARPRAAILARSVPPLGLGALAALLLVDAVPVAAVWVIAEAAQGWLAGSAAQIALAALLLGG